MSFDPIAEEAEVRAAAEHRAFRLGIVQTYGGRLAFAGCAFAASVVTARALGPAGRGTLTALMLVPTLCAAAFELGQETVLSQLVAQCRRALAALHANAIVYSFLAFVPAGAIAAGAYAGLGVGDGALTWTLAAGAIVSLALYGSMAPALLLGLGRTAAYNVARVLVTGGFLVGVVAIAVVGGSSAHRFFLAWLVAQAIVALYAGWQLGWRVARPDAALARAQARIGAPIQVSNLAQALLLRADQLVLFALAGSVATGRYAVAVNLTEAVWYVATAVGVVSVPFLSGDRPEAEKVRALTHALNVSFWFSLAAAGAIAALAPVVLPLLFGSAFSKALVPLEILIPGTIAAGVGRSAMAALIARKSYRPMLAITIGAVLLNLALVAALVPFLDAVGAAIASTVAYGAFGVATLLAVRATWDVPMRDWLWLPRPLRRRPSR